MSFWPKFHSCGCFSLRTGCLFIGYSSLILAALNLTGVSISLYKVVFYMRQNGNRPIPGHSAEDVRRASVGLYVSHAYFLLVWLYCAIISALLIVGVHQNRPNYLRIYFRSGVVLMALAWTLAVVSFVFMGYVATIPQMVWCVSLFLFLAVVRSTYLQQEERHIPSEQEMQVLHLSPQLRAVAT